MGFLFLFIGFCVFMTVYLFNKQATEKKERREAMEKAFEGLEDFEVSKKIVGLFDYFALAFDHNRKKMLYIKNGAKHIIPYSQILDVEVVEDNNTLFQKSSVRTIGGAIVGGVIAGGAGAIVGGLSGKTKQSKTVSKVQVKIKLRDINDPSIIIDCYDCTTMEADKKPVNPSSTFGAMLYEAGANDAQNIADTLSVIIDENSRPYSSTPTVQQSHRVADELVKLAELREKGFLTEEEFNSQKRALLNS